MQKNQRVNTNTPPTSSCAMPPLVSSSTLPLPSPPQLPTIAAPHPKMSVQNLVCQPSLPPMPPPSAVPSHHIALSPELPSISTRASSHRTQLPAISSIPTSLSASPPPPPSSSLTHTFPPLLSHPSSHASYFRNEDYHHRHQQQQAQQQQQQQQSQHQPRAFLHHLPPHPSVPDRSNYVPPEPRNSCSEDSTGARAPPALCVSEPKAKRPWTEQEDRLLRSLVEQLGQGLWASIAAQIPGRSGKQVRERWLNHLSPNVTKRPWSSEEDEIIIENHRRFGNCWSRIAKLLEGRSDNSVKNRFYTTLKRRLGKASGMTRTHSGKRSRSQHSNSDDSSELPHQKLKQSRVWE